jgi:predicted RNA-binding protein with RPS1 domain
VGDQILVRILSVNRDNIETLSIKADVKSATEVNMRPKLSTCRVQSKYAGRVHYMYICTGRAAELTEEVKDNFAFKADCKNWIEKR